MRPPSSNLPSTPFGRFVLSIQPPPFPLSHHLLNTSHLPSFSLPTQSLLTRTHLAIDSTFRLRDTQCHSLETSIVLRPSYTRFSSYPRNLLLPSPLSPLLSQAHLLLQDQPSLCGVFTHISPSHLLPNPSLPSPPPLHLQSLNSTADATPPHAETGRSRPAAPPLPLPLPLPLP